MSLTNHDHRMIHLAAARGVVTVLDSGQERTARLVAWRPRKTGTNYRRNVARVEFAPGRRATVKPECVEPVEVPA